MLNIKAFCQVDPAFQLEEDIKPDVITKKVPYIETHVFAEESVKNTVLNIAICYGGTFYALPAWEQLTLAGMMRGRY